MTVLETSEPVAISITGTSIDGGAAPDTIETFELHVQHPHSNSHYT